MAKKKIAIGIAACIVVCVIVALFVISLALKEKLIEESRIIPERFQFHATRKPSTVVKTSVGTALQGNISDYRTGQSLSSVIVSATKGSTHVSTKSDENGNYFLSGLSTGIWEVEVRKSGYGTVFASVTLKRNDTCERDFALLQGAQIFGSVMNSNGDILPNIIVEVNSIYEQNWKVSGTTDENGKYTLEDIKPGNSLTLSAIKPSGAGQIRQIDKLLEGEKRGPIDFVLGDGVVVSGKVYNSADLSVLSGIKLTLTSLDEHHQGKLVSTSDDDGAFSFHDVPSGAAYIIVNEDDYFYFQHRLDIPVGRDLYGQDVFLQQNAQLEIQLTDSDDFPLEGIESVVRISVLPNSTMPNHKFLLEETVFYTDDSGRFYLNQVRGRYISIEFLNDDREIYVSPYPHFEIVPGRYQSIKFMTEADRIGVYGYVLDSNGHPIEDARVWFTSLMYFEDFGAVVAEGQTGHDGKYEISNSFCRKEKIKYIFASKEGYSVEGKEVDLSRHSDDVRIDFTLNSALSISGKVVSDAGVPYENVKVSAFGPGFPPMNVVYTNDLGEFIISDLSPGNYCISFYYWPQLKGYIRFYGNSFKKDFENVPAGTNDLLVVFEERGTINLSVATDFGEPIKEYSVYYTSKSPTNLSGFHGGFGVNSSDGSVEVHHVPFGLIKMTITILGLGADQESKVFLLTNSNSPKDVNFIVSTGNTLEGYVYETGSQDVVSNAQVSISDPRTKKLIENTCTNEDGFYKLMYLENGVSYQLTASSSSGKGALNTMDHKCTKRNERRDIYLSWEAGFWGKVLDSENGEGVAGANVMIGHSIETITSSSGDFEFAVSPELVSRIFVYHDNYLPLIIEDVNPENFSDPDAPGLIYLSKGISVSGKVISPTKNLDESWTICLRGPAYRQSKALNADGHYEFINVAPGLSVVDIRQQYSSVSYRQYLQRFDIPEDCESIEKDFILPTGYTVTGTVSDSNGPCSDRIINLTQINRSSDQSSINAGTVSNNVGAFIFENIPNGEYAITSGDARVKVNVSNSNVLCDLDLDY